MNSPAKAIADTLSAAAARDDSHDSGELPRRLKGLPVAGYRPQAPKAVDAVNGMKEFEELVLRLLDDLAGDDELAPDPRWLAIGRTAIEQGFMAVNRSIFKPARISIFSEDEPVVETGWVLEREDSPVSEPLYFRGGSPHETSWSKEDGEAVRFSREIDAANFAVMLGVRARVCEHQWG